MSVARCPLALTIAGSDCSGGAGLQADMKTFMAFDVWGASVVTALTAQNTCGVLDIHISPPSFIGRQIEAVATDLDVAAVKTGMLGDRATVVAVAEGIAKHKLAPLVVDPVMVATSGSSLLADDAVEAVRGLLLPLADLVTPNLPEAAVLLREPIAKDLAAAQRQAQAILGLGPKAVLLKGGHANTETADDVLATRERVLVLSRPRIPLRSTRGAHGTGCTLSAAITACLARSYPLCEAVEIAKAFVWKAITAGQAIDIGHGTNVLDHRVKPGI